MVVQLLQIDPADIESLPDEIREQFPEVVDQLREGGIDEVPDRVLNALPPNVVDRIPESLLASSVNTTFVIILAAIAAVCLLGFFYGLTKAAIKAAMFFLVLSGIAGVVLYAQY